MFESGIGRKKERIYWIDLEKYCLNLSAMARKVGKGRQSLHTGLKEDELIIIRQTLAECLVDIDNQLLGGEALEV